MVLAFDLDGTLLDARPRQVEVARHAVARVAARTLEGDRFWGLKRAGADTEHALVQLGYARPLAAEAAALWRREVEADHWLEHDRALPGAAQVLAQLRARRVTIAVITARSRPAGARTSLRAAGLAGLVDALAVVDPTAAPAGKAAWLVELEARGFVGDSAVDGQAAHAARVPFVAVSTGQRASDYLRALGYEVAPALSDAVKALVEVPVAALGR